MDQQTVWIFQIASQVATVIILAVGFIVALIQFRLARRQRVLVAITEVLKEIADEQYGYHEGKLLRHWLCQRSRPLELPECEAFQQPARERIIEMALAHDRMCFFIHEGGSELNCILEWQRDEIRRLWWALTPIILGMRGTQHGFCKMFELYGRN